MEHNGEKNENMDKGTISCGYCYGIDNRRILDPSHKAYMREAIMPEKPDMTPGELATRLNMPFRKHFVVLYELSEETKSPS